MARALASHHSMTQAFWTEKILGDICEGIQSLIMNILDTFCKQRIVFPGTMLSHHWDVNKWVNVSMCEKGAEKCIQRREWM